MAAASVPAEAERVLRQNDNGGYTVPSRSTYPHQWNWDSALAALGWGAAWGRTTHLDAALGLRVVRAQVTATAGTAT